MLESTGFEHPGGHHAEADGWRQLEYDGRSLVTGVWERAVVAGDNVDVKSIAARGSRANRRRPTRSPAPQGLVVVARWCSHVAGAREGSFGVEESPHAHPHRGTTGPASPVSRWGTWPCRLAGPGRRSLKAEIAGSSPVRATSGEAFACRRSTRDAVPVRARTLFSARRSRRRDKGVATVGRGACASPTQRPRFAGATWIGSSVGRALRSHRRGQGFKSLSIHKSKVRRPVVTSCWMTRFWVRVPAGPPHGPVAQSAEREKRHRSPFLLDPILAGSPAADRRGAPRGPRRDVMVPDRHKAEV